MTGSPVPPAIIIGWGATNDDSGNFVGQIYPPPGLTNVIAISAGGFRSLALNRDGSIVAWGKPTTIPAGLSNVIGIASGYDHSLVLRSDGSVVAWGSNVSGETNVPPGLSNVVLVAAGGCNCLPHGNKSLALKRDGTVVGWGATTVTPGLSNVITISAGNNHALALKRDGTLTGWGNNSNGQAVSPLGLSNVVSIAAGGSHSMALRLDGTVIAWGNGPTNVPVGLNNVVAIAAGDEFCVALRGDGKVFAWGNWAGESVVPATLTNVIAIDAGARHVLALINNGTPEVTRQPLDWDVYSGSTVSLNVGAVGPPPLTYQWQLNGVNIAGATDASLTLANLQTNDAGAYRVVISNAIGMVVSSNAMVLVSNTPPIILNQPTNLVATLGVAGAFSIAVTGSTPLGYQWYFNGVAIAEATNATLAPALWSPEGSYRVVVSNAYGMVTSSDATLSMPRAQIVPWGSNLYGQTNLPAGLGNVLAVAAGGDNSMALKSDGTVVVWGNNTFQQRSVPTSVTNVVAIACGADKHCLALRKDGQVIGWGKMTVPLGLSNVVAIAAGNDHSLALESNGRVTAWGNNSSAQINLPSSLTNVIAIAAGDSHSLALRGDGAVVAWGANSSGQTNVPVFLTNVIAVAANGNGSLALQSNGVVIAWGINNAGQTNVPVALTNAIAIAAGASFNLALRSDGTVLGWGHPGVAPVPLGLSKVIAIAAGHSHVLSLLNAGPLLITTAPASQTTYAGFPVSFTANVLGERPIAYRWQFNGADLENATNASLTLFNIQPTNAGNYTLIVSNSFGGVTSSNAALIVITNSPMITVQPTNQVAVAGSNVTFAVKVGLGPVPNIFQWQSNGTNISGATNPTLTLMNVQLTNQGIYTVRIDNAFGSVVSSNALLTVLDLPTALNAPGMNWTTAGGAAWFPQTAQTHDGLEAAQSGAVTNGQMSTLQTAVTGPGTLTFWWRFSPLTFPGNLLTFESSERNSFASVNSTTGWQQRTQYLGAGMQTLTWNYSRAPFVSGQSTGWVDQVTFTPGGTAPLITAMSPDANVRANANKTFGVSALGTPPLMFQWQLNGVDLVSQTNSFLSLLNVQPTNAGVYTVTVSNTFGAMVTNATLWVSQFAINGGPTNLLMTSNGFQLTLEGVLTTNPVIIFGSTDLVNWVPAFTNAAITGSVRYLDVTATNFPLRFYRARE